MTFIISFSILLYLQDYLDVINDFPEFDKPSYFGLPENSERSAQRIVSGQVISQLKMLQKSDAKATKFDKEVWTNELGPILNLWKKVNQVYNPVFILTKLFVED